jgi:hypothetical protein
MLSEMRFRVSASSLSGLLKRSSGYKLLDHSLLMANVLLQAADHETEHFNRLHSSFKGTARVGLQYLDFDSHTELNVSESNTKRLVRVFENEGCLRLDPEHHVPVLVPRNVLDAALVSSNLTQEALHDPVNFPTLTFAPGTALRVLHGRHRLRAASKFLSVAAGKWWTADLYSDGESPAMSTSEKPLTRTLRASPGCRA